MQPKKNKKIIKSLASWKEPCPRERTMRREGALLACQNGMPTIRVINSTKADQTHQRELKRCIKITKSSLLYPQKTISEGDFPKTCTEGVQHPRDSVLMMPWRIFFSVEDSQFMRTWRGKKRPPPIINIENYNSRCNNFFAVQYTVPHHHKTTLQIK